MVQMTFYEEKHKKTKLYLVQKSIAIQSNSLPIENSFSKEILIVYPKIYVFLSCFRL